MKQLIMSSLILFASLLNADVAPPSTKQVATPAAKPKMDSQTKPAAETVASKEAKIAADNKKVDSEKKEASGAEKLNPPTPPAKTTLYEVSFDNNVEKDGISLKLIGVALRSKLWFKVYVIGHYQAAARTKDDIKKNPTDANHARMIRLVLKRDVSKDDMIAAVDKSIKDNTSEDVFQKITPALTTFKSWFNENDFKDGSQLAMIYMPKTGLEVSLNNTQKGIIKDSDFVKAIFDVWLGEKPVTNAMKKSLLGD